ncbi:hypothetical protein Lser_V15G45032 [Lactuca serriola]
MDQLSAHIFELRAKDEEKTKQIKDLQTSLGSVLANYFNLKNVLYDAFGEKVKALFQQPQGIVDPPSIQSPPAIDDLPVDPPVPRTTTIVDGFEKEPEGSRARITIKQGKRIVTTKQSEGLLFMKNSNENRETKDPVLTVTDLKKRKFCDEYGDRTGIRMWAFDPVTNLWVVKRKSGASECYKSTHDFNSWTKTDLAELSRAPFHNPSEDPNASNFKRFLDRQVKENFPSMKTTKALYKKEKDVLDPETGEPMKISLWPATKKKKSLPKTFQASNLVTLEMCRSKIILLWEGEEPKKLRFLDLSYSTLKTLDLWLVLNLETFTLTGCGDLIEFPDGNWKLEHLKSLELDGCKLLEKLSDDLHRLGVLEKLNLSSTSIEYLPDSISILKHLKYLELDRCQLIEKLPEDLGQLDSLEHLSLSSTKIQHLPDSICMLKHLESLKLEDCTFLEKILEDLGQLESLERLTLSYTKTQYLPDSICMLKRLESVNLINCRLLEKLPEDLGQLDSLEQLSLSSTKIKHLPNSICDCWFLEKLPEDLGHLKCLDKLHISYTKIKHFPNSISMLKHLKVLKLHDLSSFEMLPEDLSGLRCLKVQLLLSTKIRHLPDSICMLKHLKPLSLAQYSISMLKHLKVLKLDECRLLEMLPEDLGGLDCLEVLRLSYKKIRNLPDSICMLIHLEYLYLDHCLLLEKLSEGLSRHLPDNICMLKQQRVLNLRECSLLENLPEDLGELESLEFLNIVGGLLHSFGYNVEDEDEDINEDQYIYEYEDDYEDQYGYGYEYDDYMKTNEEVADILTKSLASGKLIEFNNMMGMVEVDVEKEY